MNALTKQIGAVTNGMDAVLGTMDVDRIGRMMDNFEKQFDSLDVRSGYMESAIAHSTASAVPQEQVDEFIKMVRARASPRRCGCLRCAVGVARLQDPRLAFPSSCSCAPSFLSLSPPSLWLQMQAQNAVEFKDSLAVGASGAVGPYGVGASAGASSAAPREAVAAGVPPPAAAAPAPAPGAGGAQPPAGPPAGGSGSDVADSLAARLAALRSSR